VTSITAMLVATPASRPGKKTLLNQKFGGAMESSAAICPDKLLRADSARYRTDRP
jgi:hypothetical protein